MADEGGSRAHVRTAGRIQRWHVLLSRDEGWERPKAAVKTCRPAWAAGWSVGEAQGRRQGFEMLRRAQRATD